MTGVPKACCVFAAAALTLVAVTGGCSSAPRGEAPLVSLQADFRPIAELSSDSCLAFLKRVRQWAEPDGRAVCRQGVSANWFHATLTNTSNSAGAAECRLDGVGGDGKSEFSGRTLFTFDPIGVVTLEPGQTLTFDWFVEFGSPNGAPRRVKVAGYGADCVLNPKPPV